MENIKDLIVCPKCKCALTDDLLCNSCKTSYQFKHGVYNIVNHELSSNQLILWKISDEDLEDDVEEANQKEEDNDWTKDYEARKNTETKIAEKKLDEYTMSLLQSLEGDVCDLATGRGGMLQMLLDAENNNITITCTDISDKILAWTRKKKHRADKNIFYIASDGRYMSIKDESFDYITSFAAFGNIPECDKVAKELYRILKPNGKLIIQGTYIEKESASYELAKSYGLEKGMVEEYLLQELEKAGFQNIVSTVVDEAIWAENPYDALPVANDKQRYCVIQAQRIESEFA